MLVMENSSKQPQQVPIEAIQPPLTGREGLDLLKASTSSVSGLF